MNWLFGVIGAFLGAVFGAGGTSFLGFLLGAIVGFLASAAFRQSRRLDALSNEVLKLQRILAVTSRPAAPAPEAPAAAVPAATAPTAPVASTPTPTPAPVAAPEIPAAAKVDAPQVVRERAPNAAVFEAREPTPPPLPPRAPRAPSPPDFFDKTIAAVKGWFTEGNVPVKIGVLVLIFGVFAALRYAVAEGYLHVSIETRLALIAGAAMAGLGFGWHQRIVKREFAVSLQGGALGVLLGTVFAAFKLYSLLPPTLALGLVVVIVAGSAMLAVLQRAMWLAVLGFLGGYLAPVLINTGSGNHVALFSYYALLNAAVLAISWKQSWRLLNLIGFFFTFGVGAMWGNDFYVPEKFWTVEPFLILFFVFYIGIGLLYVIKQTAHPKPWVDGTLIFGTPLVAFPLQAAMLKDDRMGLALSALVVSLLYAGLLWWVRRRKGERLLAEAYGALALGFATLAVPLAFSASTTASLWALEGAGACWIGLRQKRTFPWLAGLALQLLAAGSYCIALFNGPGLLEGQWLLMNPQWLGAAMLSFAGFALSLIHDRHKPVLAIAPLTFLWALFWWLVGGMTQVDHAELSIGEWNFAVIYLSVSIAGAAALRRYLPWPRLDWMTGFAALLGLLCVFAADDEYGAPLALRTLPTWAGYAVALVGALWSVAGERRRSLVLAHLAWLWTIALALSMQMKDVVDQNALAEGWNFIAVVAPVALMTLGLWKRPALLAWPRAPLFASYGLGWFGLAMPILAFGFVVGLFLAGDPAPLAYLPVLNPLELALIGLAALAYGLAGDFALTRSARKGWPIVGFVLLTMATLRAVHFLHGEPWSGQIMDSGFSQSALTVVWSLVGVSSWILGSRRKRRDVWIGGAVLMGIVLAKLMFVDRTYMGNMPGIISFIAVGLLLVGVGWIAPQPPKLIDGGSKA